MEKLVFSKEFLGILASVISLVGYIPYIRDMLKGHTRLHIFSWIIWTLITGIVFFAQLTKGAGPGSWVTGLTSVICLGIVVLTIKQGDRSVTPSDWISFVLALMTIPVWRMMNDPTLAVILATFVYSLAYYPTFRKSYSRPHEETLFAYVLSPIKSVFSIMATQELSVATVFYPAFTIIINTSFIMMVVRRRKNIIMDCM